MFFDRLKLWVKSNKWICYLIAVACFFIIIGVFFYRNTGAQGAKLAFTALCVFFWCLICVVGFCQRKKDGFIYKSFFIVLLALGTLHSLVFQPITIPDEYYHFQNSYKYSNFIMFKKDPGYDSLLMRSDDVEEMNNTFTDRLTYPRYLEIIDGFKLFDSSDKEIFIEPQIEFDLLSNLPQTKLPSAIGITIARLFGLGFYPLFYLGRLFSFLFFACLSYLAVKTTPVGKNAFMAISLLPMTINIAGSYANDAGIIGLSFLFIALCLKAAYTSKQVTRKNLIAIAIIAILLAPCKLVYSLLIVMVLVVPATVFSSKKRARLYKSGVIFLSICSVLLLRLSMLLYVAGVESSGLVNRGGEEGYYHTISEFFIDPLGTIAFFARSLDVFGDFYITTLIGGWLGWFQDGIAAPWFVVLAFIFLLALSFLKTPDDSAEINKKHRILYFSIFCLGLFAIMLGMFIGWTFTHETEIQGVQGRYLLPFLPMIALAIRSNTVVSKRNLHIWIVFGLFALNIAYLIRIFSIITATHI